MKSRKWLSVALLGAGFLFAGFFPRELCAESQLGLVVKTDTGKVQGKQDGATLAFLGIPYAAPPTGELRWKPPAPAARWKGVRPAQEFGARCMQGPIYTDMIFRDSGPSEDCLNLNVWTAARNKKAKLPVMVWIYGGGFTAGSASEPRQDGARLAARGVVVVSMNYRLTVFGFFTHPGLAGESGHDSAGNYGLMDQVAALEWVKRNISRFGGDPGNVTIFGESAGSFSVSSLMASPLAHGLFQKAIGESGGAFHSEALPYEPLAAREKRDAQWAQKELGVQSLAALRALPAQRLLDAAVKSEKDGGIRFGPDIDGYYLPEDPEAIFAAGKQNDVPLLAGWNHDEGSFATAFSPTPPTLAGMKEMAAQQFGARAAEFLKVFGVTSDESAPQADEDLAGDRFIALSAWRWLDAQEKTGTQPVYRYRFDQAPPADKNTPAAMGAFHSSEIVYVFGNLDARPLVSWREDDRKVSQQMQMYWTDFACSGNPNGPGLPEWPEYSARTGWQVMYLNPNASAAPDTQRERFLFLDNTAK